MEPSLQQLGQAVKRLQWHHHREANRRLAAIGSSLAHWDVLRNLHEHPDASLHDLALLTFQTDQSMGTLATRMIDRGLLERVSGPGRAIRHRLTADGERTRREGGRVIDEVLMNTLGTLSRDDRATLYRLLKAATPDPD
ncbi:MarR family winged helix-turn-helix transcriptional regulator [Nocardia sp. CDC160]|uniref:MarR family winged helix-turn-helix transcriptional regulator n=1 Tax=Nocardia sp. CDC160 TaxID=3112166 RepID=UPI002DBD0BD1|nr:MarR family transcriptional regulator [Nocardia sp. CDC160]MEC3918507.1 MarR family transcriptional regulator [Nocardia sp. CDC160]